MNFCENIFEALNLLHDEYKNVKPMNSISENL
jgi:hypothetical protein